MPDFDFTTGPATLPDVGVLSYNGCLFSPLFTTTVHGVAVKDNAHRTTKLMDYTITADGYVTLSPKDTSVSPQMSDLRRMLTAQGGALVYQGRGMDLVVNPVGAVAGAARDVAWGPVPEILEFQPLGAGRSAKVRWQVKVRIPEIAPGTTRGGLAGLPILQFNYETVVSYDDACYANLAVRGTLEIPLTRTPQQTTRTLTYTVDEFRRMLDSRIFVGLDLSRFRVTRRNFNISRDKRTLEWDFAAEEKAYMDLPPDCTVARGTFSVRPARSGMGMALWLCTLRATYTVRKDRPRRFAWFPFLLLLRARMVESERGFIPTMPDGGGGAPRGPGKFPVLVGALAAAAAVTIKYWTGTLGNENKAVAEAQKVGRPFLMDFSVDEGLYLDSRTTSFSATWRIVTSFSHILLASGLWKKVDEKDPTGKNYWATSVADIQQSKAWKADALDPNLDIIVDFGGG